HRRRRRGAGTARLAGPCRIPPPWPGRSGHGLRTAADRGGPSFALPGLAQDTGGAPTDPEVQAMSEPVRRPGQRPGGPAIGARHQTIVRLFDEGLTARQIAAAVGVTSARVNYVLRGNGRDSRARSRAARRAAAQERFRALWASSASMAE